MKFFPFLFLLTACSPNAVNDFVIGEEKVINQVIQDETNMPIGFPLPVKQEKQRPKVECIKK